MRSKNNPYDIVAGQDVLIVSTNYTRTCRRLATVTKVGRLYFEVNRESNKYSLEDLSEKCTLGAPSQAYSSLDAYKKMKRRNNLARAIEAKISSRLPLAQLEELAAMLGVTVDDEEVILD